MAEDIMVGEEQFTLSALEAVTYFRTHPLERVTPFVKAGKRTGGGHSANNRSERHALEALALRYYANMAAREIADARNLLITRMFRRHVRALHAAPMKPGFTPEITLPINRYTRLDNPAAHARNNYLHSLALLIDRMAGKKAADNRHVIEALATLPGLVHHLHHFQTWPQRSAYLDTLFGIMEHHAGKLAQQNPRLLRRSLENLITRAGSMRVPMPESEKDGLRQKIGQMRRIADGLPSARRPDAQRKTARAPGIAAAILSHGG